MISSGRTALILLIHSRGLKFQCFLIQVDFKKHFSVIASGICSGEPTETINYFYFGIYFKGNQFKQLTFFSIFFCYSIYLKLIKNTGLMYSLKETSFRILFR